MVLNYFLKKSQFCFVVRNFYFKLTKFEYYKMQRVYLILFVLFLLSGCSSDDENEGNKLIGTWKLVEVLTGGW